MAKGRKYRRLSAFHRIAKIGGVAHELALQGRIGPDRKLFLGQPLPIEFWAWIEFSPGRHIGMRDDRLRLKFVALKKIGQKRFKCGHQSIVKVRIAIVVQFDPD